jgi:Transmembrane amino acid transporter protein
LHLNNDSFTSDHSLLIKSEAVHVAKITTEEDLEPSSAAGLRCNPKDCVSEFYVATLLLFSSTTAVALATSDLGVVLALTGAVVASLLGNILPPLLFLASHKCHILPPKWRLIRGLATALFPQYALSVNTIAFGCVACVLGVVSVFLPGGL